MKTVLGLIGLLTACGTTGNLGPTSGLSDEALAVAKAASSTRRSLADAIEQLSNSPETAISAKFEFDHAGVLSLSVYTVERGLGVDAEHNVLKEYAGAPNEATWTPSVEVFGDFEHVARSAQQATLLALSEHSLVEILARAEKDVRGRALSITPVLHGREAFFVVEVAGRSGVVEAKYALLDDEHEDADDAWRAGFYAND